MAKICPRCKEPNDQDWQSYCTKCQADYQRERNKALGPKIKRLEAEVKRLRFLLAWCGVDPDAK